MPYKSKAQQRKFFAMESRGELPKGTALEWAHETPNLKSLPEHVKKSTLLAHAHDSGSGIAKSQLRAGEKVEMEHTTHKPVARQIAIDHLRERPDYYVRLKKVEGEKTSNYKLQGETKFKGLDIAIENKKGSERKWFDPHGKEKGSTHMHFDYGYIRLTKGTDGDHVDVYLGPNEESDKVFIVDQMKKPDFKEFDEQKVMLGFDTADAAEKAYRKQYNDSRFFGSMKEMPFEEFKMKVLDKDNHGKKIAAAQTQIQGLKSFMGHANIPLHHVSEEALPPGAAAFYMGSVLKKPMDAFHELIRSNPKLMEDPKIRSMLEYHPGGVHIPTSMSDSPEVLAHEIGHAVADQKHPRMAVAESAGKLLIGNKTTAPAVGFAAGAMTGDNSSSARETATPVATVLGTSAPLALSEGQAWHYGAKPLREVGGNMSAYHRLNAQNMIEQVAPVAYRGAVGYGAGRMVRSVIDRSRKKKSALSPTLLSHLGHAGIGAGIGAAAGGVGGALHAAPDHRGQGFVRGALVGAGLGAAGGAGISALKQQGAHQLSTLRAQAGAAEQAAHEAHGIAGKTIADPAIAATQHAGAGGLGQGTMAARPGAAAGAGGAPGIALNTQQKAVMRPTAWGGSSSPGAPVNHELAQQIAASRGGQAEALRRAAGTLE